MCVWGGGGRGERGERGEEGTAVEVNRKYNIVLNYTNSI